MSDFLAPMLVAIGEPAAAAHEVEPGGEPGFASALPVDDLLRSAIASVSLAAARLGGGGAVRLDPARVRSASVSSGVFRINGVEPSVWAELSGFWRCADGWLRTHANYPHHRARLLGALGLAHTADKVDVARAVESGRSADLEDRIVAAGGIASRVRTVEEWLAHPQGHILADQPLLTRGPLGSAAPYPEPGHPDPAVPLRGVRVLDLTRVIAGPIATRTLALLGADVLRVDDPNLPEPEWQHLDSGAGKHSTLLDLRAAADRARFDELVDAADVVVTGYRPGSLDRVGLAPEALAERRPGIIVAQVSAWGSDGPWGGRRGFDSIVQAASGIAMAESRDGETPGALPVQALDHATGYLTAAAVVSALRTRRESGQGMLLGLALARVAHELLIVGDAQGRARSEDRVPPGFPTATEFAWAGGTLTTALPAPHFEGGPDVWPAGPRAWGADPAAWQ